MSAHDSASVTTLVAVDAATAFAVFTEEVDAWWGRGPRYRFGRGREGTLRFEPGAHGRLVELFTDGDKQDGDEHEVGRVHTWDPPRRLAFGFRARDFAPGETTEVEVTFEPEGASTRVTVVHRGWDAFPPEHPMRHGLVGPAWKNRMGSWWGDQMLAWKRRVETQRA